jgi:hypothetical protein
MSLLGISWDIRKRSKENDSRAARRELEKGREIRKSFLLQEPESGASYLIFRNQ